jgi:hypothetical protein
MSKEKKQDLGLGDFMLPVVDLLTIVITKGIEGFAALIGMGIEKLINGNSTGEIVKLEREDLKKNKGTTDFDSIGYSVLQKRKIKGADINKTKHSVIVGASGSGKSVLLDSLMFDDMRTGKPVIYIDPKADNESLERFIDLCRLNKREYLVFSEHYEKDGKISLNPVLEGSANHIADRVFKSFTWSEEFYANKSHQALKKSVKSLKSKNITISLQSIYDEINLLCESRDKSIKVNRSEIEGLLTKIDNIVDSDFGDSLKGPNAYSFTRLRDEGKCVYIGLSVLGYAETARAIGKLFLGDINYSVYNTYRNITPRNKVNLKPLGLYIDELSAIITDEFVEILNKCRGAKVEITSAFQTSSDINKISPDLCQQVFENSLNWFVMKQRMDESASLLSYAIGTNESVKKTVKIEDDQEQNSGSQRAVEELLVHPNVIKNLGVGQCVLFRQQPTQIDLMNVKYIDQETIDRNLSFFENNQLISKRSRNLTLDVGSKPESGGALHD